MVFRGKDLGATTTSVSIENEDGEIIEKVIPKSEFRKDLAVFSFENSSSDTSLNYLQYAFPILIENDLNQDVYMRARAAISYYHRLKEMSYPEGLNMPLKTMSNFAEYYHLKYFLAGSFNF